VEREQADGISMDCLGALGKTKVSLPCIAWSKMNDDGIPAACEADIGAMATHALVQQLFDRPGFQQDPVADTANSALVGAHCSCPTRLNGFGSKPEPFDIVHHHGMRDATARPKWTLGQRVTLADVVIGTKDKPTQIIVAAGSVTENVLVPPAGGCVISIRAKFDGNTDVLKFPGFHQLFFYGDYKKQIVEFCKLQKLEAVVA
jgi:L-fucose isomerase-like protein